MKIDKKVPEKNNEKDRGRQLERIRERQVCWFKMIRKSHEMVYSNREKE